MACSNGGQGLASRGWRSFLRVSVGPPSCDVDEDFVGKWQLLC